MPKRYRYKHKICINKQLIPVKESIYLFYYQSRRRIKYIEYDIKIGINIRDKKGKIIRYIPSKEDSLERITANGHDFPDSTNDMEDTVIRKLMIEKLRACLHMLPDADRRLILAIFADDEKSERQIACELDIPESTLNYKKHKILAKLHKLISK